MGIFRSEPMSKGTLVLPSEGARGFLEIIASHTLVQFVDMNAQTMHRRYKRYVQRLEEMERILRFLYAQIEQHAAAAREAIAASGGEESRKRFTSFSWRRGGESRSSDASSSSSDSEVDDYMEENEDDGEGDVEEEGDRYHGENDTGAFSPFHSPSSPSRGQEQQQQPPPPLQQQLLPRLLSRGPGSGSGSGGDSHQHMQSGRGGGEGRGRGVMETSGGTAAGHGRGSSSSGSGSVPPSSHRERSVGGGSGGGANYRTQSGGGRINRGEQPQTAMQMHDRNAGADPFGSNNNSSSCGSRSSSRSSVSAGTLHNTRLRRTAGGGSGGGGVPDTSATSSLSSSSCSSSSSSSSSSSRDHGIHDDDHHHHHHHHHGQLLWGGGRGGGDRRGIVTETHDNGHYNSGNYQISFGGGLQQKQHQHPSHPQQRYLGNTSSSSASSSRQSRIGGKGGRGGGRRFVLPPSRPPVFQLDRVEEALNKLYSQFIRFSQNNDDLLRQRDAAIEECSLLLLAVQQLQPVCSSGAEDGSVMDVDSAATAASGRFGSKAPLRSGGGDISSDGSSLLADGVGVSGGGRRRRQFPRRAAGEDAFGECVAVEIRSMAFSSIAGVLRSADQEKFARALFRATRGNAYTYLQPADSGQLPPAHAHTLESKSLFVTYYQGGRSPSSAAYEKVMRLCVAFGVHCYTWPSTYEEACRRLADLEVQLADKAHALRGYETYFLSEIAVLLEPVSAEEEEEEEEADDEDGDYTQASSAPGEENTRLVGQSDGTGGGRERPATASHGEATGAAPPPSSRPPPSWWWGESWWQGRPHHQQRGMPPQTHTAAIREGGGEGRGGGGGGGCCYPVTRGRSMNRSRSSNDMKWIKKKRARKRPLIEEWRRFCVKEKAIYVALNMFEDSGATLRAECWFPTYQEANLRFLIAEQSSRSQATAFLLLQHPPWGRSWSDRGGAEERGGASLDVRSSSSCSYFFGAAAQQVAPTFFRLPSFLLPFQQLVDTYGVPRHREINPAVFACVFFPFLFGVMYGDVGHGAALLAAAAALFSLNAKIGSKTLLAWKHRHRDSLRSLISARHMLFLMGFFATYAGLIYNEVLSLGVDVFGSRWQVERVHGGQGGGFNIFSPQHPPFSHPRSPVPSSVIGESDTPSVREAREAAALHLSERQAGAYEARGLQGIGEEEIDREDEAAATAATFHFAAPGERFVPASHGFPYPFGFDPVWKGATNELAVFNSFKMKFAVIVGFAQMLLGLVLHALNTVAARDWVTFFWVAVPQVLLFISLIGYIVFLIIFKWVTPTTTYKKPSLINVLIDMHIQPTLFADLPPDLRMFECQPLVQRILRVVAYASIPCLLLGKPLWLYFKQRCKRLRGEMQPCEGLLLLRSVLSNSGSLNSSGTAAHQMTVVTQGGGGGRGRPSDAGDNSHVFGGSGNAAGRNRRWPVRGGESEAPFFDEEAAVFSSRHSLESSSTAAAAPVAGGGTSSSAYPSAWSAVARGRGGEGAGGGGLPVAGGHKRDLEEGGRSRAGNNNNNNTRAKKRGTRQVLLFEENSGSRPDWAGAAEEVSMIEDDPPSPDGEPQKHTGEPLSEVFIHQVIETIEFVLGTVSNTASYLRLWALSLAHQQLATVFFENTVGFAFKPGLNEVQMVFRLLLLFPVFALITLFVMLCMDSLECFLHALRLQWVEFQSKFYKADGYPFEPLSFSRILRESKSHLRSTGSNANSSDSASGPSFKQ